MEEVLAEDAKTDAYTKKHHAHLDKTIQEQEEYLEHSPIANMVFGGGGSSSSTKNLRMKDVIKLPGVTTSSNVEMSLAMHSPSIMRKKVQKVARTLTPEQKQKALEYAKEAAPYWGKRLREAQRRAERGGDEGGGGDMHFFK